MIDRLQLSLRRAWKWAWTKEQADWTAVEAGMELDRRRAREQAAGERIQELFDRMNLGMDVKTVPATEIVAALFEELLNRYERLRGDHENLKRFIVHPDFWEQQFGKPKGRE